MYGGMHVMFGGLGDKWYKQLIGPLQLVIYAVQNYHAEEQKSHWEKTIKWNYHLKLYMPFVCLVPEPHEGLIFDCTGNPNHINSMLFWLTTGFNWYFAPIMGEHFTSPPPLPPAPLEKKERKISKVKFNFTYRPSWSGESYCDAFCWKSRWNWPLQHSQQVFAFPYAISLIRVRFEQFRKGDHLKAYIQ